MVTLWTLGNKNRVALCPSPWLHLERRAYVVEINFVLLCTNDFHAKNKVNVFLNCLLCFKNNKNKNNIDRSVWSAQKSSGGTRFILWKRIPPRDTSVDDQNVYCVIVFFYIHIISLFIEYYWWSSYITTPQWKTIKKTDTSTCLFRTHNTTTVLCSRIFLAAARRIIIVI